jgi:periplasmic protein TonB
VAAGETATQSIPNVAESPHSVAPAAGTGESARRERVTSHKELAAHLDKFRRYPSDRLVPRAEVVVSFVLDRVGCVLSKRVAKGSGAASFDAAALEMLQRSDPVPPPPPLVADDELTFSLPVIFHAKPTPPTNRATSRLATVPR